MTGEGEVIAGRYRLMSRVGRGGMGEVWLARDERLHREVAVKRLLVDVAADEASAEQVSRWGMREGRVAARLRHPHAVTVHDVVEHAGAPCLIMEYFPARSLSDVLAERGTLAPPFVAAVGAQVASALAAAHAEGIVHRDVKPGNVLIAADGTAKIADFGISRAMGDGTESSAGLIAGTPAYLAPEVAGGEPANFSSDVFSLGATLYAALEGGPPFGHDDNPIALLHRVADGEVVPPRRSGPLTDVLLWMLRRSPGERPLMREVHEALAALASGHSPRTLPPRPPRIPTLLLPARRPSRRVLGTGIVAVCLVTLGIVIGALLSQEPATVVAHTETRTQNAPPPATTSSSTTQADLAACEAEYDVNNSWPGGYQVTVTVRNDSGPELRGWTVRWAMPAGHTINNLWNGSLSQDGSAVTVRNANWNFAVAANGSTTFGFIADAPRADQQKRDYPPRPTMTCQAPG